MIAVSFFYKISRRLFVFGETAPPSRGSGPPHSRDF